MAPRGVGAAVVIVSLVLSMSVLSSLGYYALLGDRQYDVSGQNEDVQRAASELRNISYGEGGGNAFFEGPLAAVQPAVDMLSTLRTVVFNTSGVMQFLFGLPAAAADAIATVFRLALMITMAYLIRSGAPV